MIKAEDMGKFYRIPADMRDLNYDKYLSSGNEEITMTKDYTSENTRRLNVDEIIEKLLSIKYIQTELNSKDYIGVSK